MRSATPRTPFRVRWRFGCGRDEQHGVAQSTGPRRTRNRKSAGPAAASLGDSRRKRARRRRLGLLRAFGSAAMWPLVVSFATRAAPARCAEIAAVYSPQRSPRELPGIAPTAFKRRYCAVTADPDGSARRRPARQTQAAGARPPSRPSPTARNHCRRPRRAHQLDDDRTGAGVTRLGQHRDGPAKRSRRVAALTRMREHRSAPVARRGTRRIPRRPGQISPTAALQ